MLVHSSIEKCTWNHNGVAVLLHWRTRGLWTHNPLETGERISESPEKGGLYLQSCIGASFHHVPGSRKKNPWLPICHEKAFA